jgi:type IV secretory pathway VirB2 component (pilin)
MLNKIKYAVYAVPAIIMAAATAASAQTAPAPDVAGDITTALTGAIPSILAVIAAVGAGMIVVAVAKWGWNSLMGAIGGGGKKVAK